MAEANGALGHGEFGPFLVELKENFPKAALELTQSAHAIVASARDEELEYLCTPEMFETSKQTNRRRCIFKMAS